MSKELAVEQNGFILTRQWRDSPKGLELDYWLSTPSGPVQITIPSQFAIFFIAQDQCLIADGYLRKIPGWNRKSLDMRDFSGSLVCGYYFSSQRKLREARETLIANGLDPLEADINPQDRYLMERFIRGSIKYLPTTKANDKYPNRVVSPKIGPSDYRPLLKVISLDIETAMQGVELYSIGLFGMDEKFTFEKVFMVSSHAVSDKVDIFENERDLVAHFLDWLADYDPDIIIGWNVINFDMWFLEKVCQKHRIPFRCGRNGSNAHWRLLDEESERRTVVLPGRIVLDGIEVLKIAGYSFESFSLNNVAKKILSKEKLIQGDSRGEKITDLFLENKKALAEYNIVDCKLVWSIFEKTGLLDFSIARSQITGLPLDRLGGSVASFDFRYLPLLHRHGYVAPNIPAANDIETSPGGFVMNSRPGIYENVAVLDFKSLYPSIIRSFKIDPMGMAIASYKNLDQSDMVPGFNGGWFAKKPTILPELIADLWASRDAAKKRNDSALSQAIKIIMNSFYGVLGTPGCRFFDARLASSITRRGHQIIQQTADYVEAKGWQVIYGDTDSVFVWFKGVSSPEAAGHHAGQLEESLNVWWKEKLQKEYGVDSALDIEFETLYQRFLMPTVRGSSKGSKKRYAGVVSSEGKQKLVFKGLENVRSDWTKLARDFQYELYRRIFFNEPYREYVKDTVNLLKEGGCDEELVYRKRLRRKLDDYKKNIPPHVQAARKLALAGEKVRRGDWIEYVVTVNGAEPVMHYTSLIDYQHYIDRQLSPVADSILYFMEENLAQIIDRQMAFFD